ncbi:MAG: hypothetical protein ACM31L_13825 [Actinomycetota bacterium]
MGAEDATPAVIESAVSVSAPEGGRRCRSTAAVAVRAFLELLEESAVDGQVAVDAARRIAEAIIGAGGPLSTFYSASERACDHQFDLQRIERKRTDHFGRVIAQPFAHLFDQPGAGIERKHLPQFFAAVRMMVGEEVHEEMKARASVLAEGHRTPDNMVDWEAFYDDPLTQGLLEQVLVTIGRSFRRFEPRKDWFLIVMNSNPQAISLASNAFIPKKTEDKAVREFTEVNLCRMFRALFASVHPDTFDKDRRKAFFERWGSDPDKVFGQLFVELQRLCQQVGV